MTAVAMALPALRDAIDLSNLIAATDDTGHRALKIAAATFKFDLVKGHAKTAWADLFGVPAIVEIDIPEAKMIGLAFDRPATRANGAALNLAMGTAIRVSIMAMVRITDCAMTTIAIAKMQCAIAGLHRNGTSDAFVRLAMVRHSWGGKEQRRRKGKRGCSGLHDTIYHDCRTTQAGSTQAERGIRLAFISRNRRLIIAIMLIQGQVKGIRETRTSAQYITRGLK